MLAPVMPRMQCPRWRKAFPWTEWVGLSHIHLRQQMAPRVWYAGSLSRCDYSEQEDKGYHLVTLREPILRPHLLDVDVQFRVSPTRNMVELRAVYENGEFHFKILPTPRGSMTLA